MKLNFRFLKSVFFVASVGLTFTACEPESVVTNGVITFEDVALNSSGYWNGSDFSGRDTTYESWGATVKQYSGSFHSGILTCSNDFFQDQTYLTTWWSGMACSYHTDRDSIGYGNQYSVYALTGAGGSHQFALVGSNGADCIFDVPVEVKSLMVNNSTYDYWALKEGRDGTGWVTRFQAGDTFLVTVTGSDSNGVETGKVVIPLADFRNAQTYICSEWTKIALESLGKVKKLTFTFTSTDVSAFGMNTPAYVCIDNIVYNK